MEKVKQNRIWKRTTAILLVLTMAFALCGCVRYRAIGTVHDDGTINFYVLYATATDFDDSSNSLMTEQERKKLEEAGWSIQPYSGEPADEYTYNGLVISKENIQLEKLHDEVANVNFGNQSLEGITCTKNGNLYTIDWDVSEIQNSASQSGIDVNSLFNYGGFMEFVVKLPCEPKSDNATKRSGGELTWDLSTIDESVHVEFELKTTKAAAKTTKSKSNQDDDSTSGVPLWLALTIIGAVVVAATVVCLVVILKYKKGGNPVNNGTSVSPLPNGQQMPPVVQGCAPQTPYTPTPNAQYMPPQSTPAQPNLGSGYGGSQTFGLPPINSIPGSNRDDQHLQQ